LLPARARPSSASNRGRPAIVPGLGAQKEAKLLDTNRSPADEAVKRDVIEHRGKFISVLGTKRLQHQPV
jgi:hypothetical protein